MSKRERPDNRAYSDPGLSLVESLVPPHILEAEQAVLGAAMDHSSNSLIAMKIVSMLSEWDFYRTAHRYIFAAIEFLVQNNEPCNIVSIQATLVDYNLLEGAGGSSYLMDLAMSAIPILEVAEYNAKRVKSDSIRRQLITVGNEMVSIAYEEPSAEVCLQKAQEKILEIAEKSYRQSSLIHAGNITGQVIERTLRAREQKIPSMGMKTGWKELDSMLLGWWNGDLVIVAARPSMGKTAFGLNTARFVALTQKEPVLFFSMEMTKDQVIERMLADVADVDSMKIKQGFEISDDELRRLERADKLIKNSNLFIDDTPNLTPTEIRVRVSQFKMEHQGKLGLVVIDYLQLMSMDGYRGGGDNRTAEISAISRALKGIARECKVPVIALSQLSRAVESRDDKRPMLSDLRESGAIEQDADVVIALYRDEYYYGDKSNKKGIAEVIIRKQRRGMVGTVDLIWHASKTLFISKQGVVKYCYGD